MKPWCIQHRSGWCQAADQQKRPEEAATSIKTACDHFVTLPWGIARRTPTCSDCKSHQEKRV